MAEISTIARPYAQAAFDVAKAEGSLDVWATFLGDAAQVASQVEVRQLLGNPNVASAQLVALFESAVGFPNAGTRQFFDLIVEQGRVDSLSAVNAAFLAHKHAFEGSADAYIVSAYPMSAAEVSEITAALEKKLGKKLNPIVSSDESLIGGFAVTVGDEVLDVSVRAKLARMQTALTA